MNYNVATASKEIPITKVPNQVANKFRDDEFANKRVLKFIDDVFQTRGEECKKAQASLAEFLKSSGINIPDPRIMFKHLGSVYAETLAPLSKGLLDNSENMAPKSNIISALLDNVQNFMKHGQYKNAEFADNLNLFVFKKALGEDHDLVRHAKSVLADIAEKINLKSLL